VLHMKSIGTSTGNTSPGVINKQLTIAQMAESSNVTSQTSAAESDFASLQFRSKSLMSRIVSGPNDLPELLEEETKSLEEQNNGPEDIDGLLSEDNNPSQESLSLSTKLRLEEKFLDAELLSDDPSVSTAVDLNQKSDYKDHGS